VNKPNCIKWLVLFLLLQPIWFSTLFSQNNIQNFSLSYFHNEIEDLENLLKEIGQQYNVHFIYESDLLSYASIPEFNYNNTEEIQVLLERLLSNSGITYKKIDEAVFILIPSRVKTKLSGQILDIDGVPLIGATVYMKEQETGTITNIHGEYELLVESGRQSLEVRYVGYKALEQTIYINPVTDTHKDFVMNENAPLEEIVVVGSRFSGVQLLESAQPVQLVGRNEINDLSYSEVGELLHKNVPSFHSTLQTISDGTDHIDPATLRGLGPDQLLVLVNGKRRHHSAMVNINGTLGRGSVATDLNAIPVSAIERIEVLRDGAAVIYGSDAIAGVINIVLKENINHSEVQLLGGISKQGDGETIQLNGNYGMGLGNKGGFLTLGVDFKKRGGINRSGNYTGPIFNDERDVDQESRNSFFDQTGFDGERVMEVGGASTDNAAVSLNVNIPLKPKVHFYAWGGINWRQGKATGFYRFPYQSTKQSGLFDLGFSPRLRTEIQDQSISFGIKNESGPWKIDLSNTYGANNINFNVENSNNASLGLQSPTAVDAGSFTYIQNVVNLDLYRQLPNKLNNEFNFGLEFKYEGFDQLHGEEASWIDGNSVTPEGLMREVGMQMFPGFRPELDINETRLSLGGYASVKTRITDYLQFNTAGRLEYYSDFGANAIWKAEMLFKPFESLSIRSGYNTGIRAPSMPTLFTSNTSYQFVSDGGSIIPTEISHFRHTSGVALQLDLDEIKPEKSQNLSLGLIYNPHANLSISIDAYQIDISDRILISGHVPVDASPTIQNILAPVDVSRAQFFMNGIDTRTRGMDIIIDYQVLAKPEFSYDVSFSANYNQTRVKKNSEGNIIWKGPEIFQDLQNFVFDREQVARVETATPTTKMIFSNQFEFNKWKMYLDFVRFGEVTYLHPNDANIDNWYHNEFTDLKESRDQTFSSKVVTDLTMKYRINANTSISLGCNNVFNVYPEEHQHSANVGNGIFTYSRRVSQFGLRGAYWFTKANVKF